jgi:hypothetical protein
VALFFNKFEDDLSFFGVVTGLLTGAGELTFAAPPALPGPLSAKACGDAKETAETSAARLTAVLNI